MPRGSLWESTVSRSLMAHDFNVAIGIPEASYKAPLTLITLSSSDTADPTKRFSSIKRWPKLADLHEGATIRASRR